MDKNKAVYIETYGCSANQNNSEIMAGILSNSGFLITNNLEIADILIFNTCVVKSKTESKIKRRIQDLKSNKLIIISGCMPETDFKKLKKLEKNAIFLGTRHIKEIVNLIRDFYDKKLTEAKQLEYLNNNPEIKLNLPKKPNNKIISIHQISEGCLGECSYCKTRLAKGKLFSYSKTEIIKSIESDLQQGAKEIWLTSQDCASYGLDRGKQELPELLNEILNLKHKFKLRLGMSDPNNVFPILKELIEVYKDPKIFKFIHIPIQSASNPILKHMKRYYQIEQAEKIIETFRKQIPDITIATDIIVAYPTETENDHKINIDFIKEFKPDVLNLSKFSSHKQTPAGKLKVLPSSIVSKRASELMQIHRETAKENKEKFLNKTIKVLIEKRLPNSESLHSGRDENYNIVLVKCDKEFLGKEIQVKITSFGVHNLIGEYLQNS
ncbi:MAG: tRNA (N(6)-L-threonylcarbamoyladenosine(37)-C(2))-methylthiotransferase [archaeon]|nr:tRNA (N(6)-L-threonylcarbamoyladenosine(37)-C(2))-methylthiotransferase [archaeon]